MKGLRRVFVRLSGAGFPWPLTQAAEASSVLARARALARRGMFARRPWPQRIGAKSAMAVLWPLGAARDVARYLDSETTRQASEDGLSRLGLALHAYHAALRWNVPPLEYFLYRLWRSDRRQAIDDYLYWTESGALFSALSTPPSPDPVNDKLAFHDFCLALDLPTPPLLAVYADGEVTRGDSSRALMAERDIWCKPAVGRQSLGSERWRAYGGGWQRQDGQRATAAELDRHFRDLSRERTMLVQPVLSNHDQIEPLTNGALASARVISGRRRSGKIEFVSAQLSLPWETRSASQGGILAVVDVDTGRIVKIDDRRSPGQPLGSGRVPIDAVLQRGVPAWRTALRAIASAHQALPGFPFLGWDAAFTPNGPVLLETNTGLSALLVQSVEDRPFGRTVFADVLAEYL